MERRSGETGKQKWEGRKRKIFRLDLQLCGSARAVPTYKTTASPAKGKREKIREQKEAWVWHPN
jgi:hypothetical protein